MSGQRLSNASSRALSGIEAGLGLKHEHAPDILDGWHQVDFFEVHAENYMGAGGPPHRLLQEIRKHYPLSIHGVGASIGGGARLDPEHLRRLRRLIDVYQPALFSEHLAWSSHEGVFLNDLLPLPYTPQTLAYVCDHIDELQDAIGMRMLLENPSAYVAFGASTISETDFLRGVARRTGCGLLLDVNNVHVSAVNRASTHRRISMRFRSNSSVNSIWPASPRTTTVTAYASLSTTTADRSTRLCGSFIAMCSGAPDRFRHSSNGTTTYRRLLRLRRRLRAPARSLWIVRAAARRRRHDIMSVTPDIQSLAGLQGLFADALLAADAPVPKAVMASQQPATVSRFGVYRNNVVISLIAALAARYPVARRPLWTTPSTP